jgi:hypothetical protein
MSNRNKALPVKSSTTPWTPLGNAVLQRKCACGNHATGGECEECAKKKGMLQRKPQHSGLSTQDSETVPPIVHEVLRSPGHPLDPATRAFMEPRFGHDFSGVRVHADAKAATSARAVNALAYTVGRDVVFGAGQHSPATATGQRLLAHELTHVIQQGGKQFEAGMLVRVGSPRDVSEQQADAFAEAATGGGQLQAGVQSELRVTQALQRVDSDTPDIGAGIGLSLCDAWQDPKDLSKVAAEHYLRTEHNIEPKFKEAICSGDVYTGNCHVYFTLGDFLNDVVVYVFLAGDTVDLRRADLRGPLCRYTYECKRKGPPIFTKVLCHDVPPPKTGGTEKASVGQISSA